MSEAAGAAPPGPRREGAAFSAARPSEPGGSVRGLGKVVRSGVGRRRVQTVAIVLATAMSVASAVLGLALLVASSGPFDKAFAEQRGAHLTASFDAGKVTTDQLSATVHATGVATVVGPYPTMTVSLAGGPNGEFSLPPMTIAGRAEPGGDVDAVTLTAGRWATAPNEIVLSVDGPTIGVGKSLRAPDAPGGPTLTIVGIARSVGGTADAWLSPAGLAALGEPTGYQMLYRLTTASTAAQVEAGRAAIAAAVPDGALTGATSWLTVKQEAVRTIALFVPFLTAFGVLGLVMSVLVVGNVVAGAVGAATHRIGILKAIGFTPAQVVRAYVIQALIPAAAGAGIGVIVGNLAAGPVLTQTESVYATAGLAVAPWIDVAVPAGALALVALTAWISALRAGRLRTVDALAVGRTPRAGRGRWAARLSARLPLPRPVTLGLSRPFAHPARALAMVAAVTFGAAAVTFGIGLGASLSEVQRLRNHNADVTIDAMGPPQQGPEGGPPPGGPPPPGAGPKRQGSDPNADGPDPAKVAAAINAQSGTQGFYGTSQHEVAISGLAGNATVYPVVGDASGYWELISGRWFDGPGEVVVPTTVLTATGTKVGDTLTLATDGATVTARIVGEIFDTSNDGRSVYTDATTYPDRKPGEYQVAVRPGTDLTSYSKALDAAVDSLGLSAYPSVDGAGGDIAIAVTGLATTLALMLAAIAALGVLNAAVLDTRERVREIGIHKALGMVPRQTIAMVVASVAVVGLAGGLLGTPAGAAMHAAVMPAMGDSAGLTLPPAVMRVYQPAWLVLLVLGGLVIAVFGAVLPAGWAAKVRTATALRTE
ncbi:FtsX-like permease family protein [Micromonospora sp. CPCC 206061]|uniref:FtsX-like permease family protein n=1 Tax=Micromonospora sp. CPCC 206061 TaxID=3122410 RepID=UPI002FF2C6C2